MAAATCPFAVDAQLLRSDSAPQAQSSGSQQTITAPPAATPPAGKRRFWQEVQLTGDQLWTKTGITVQPGEHVVATVTGKVHYANAVDDAGPTGLVRGFKD